MFTSRHTLLAATIAAALSLSCGQTKPSGAGAGGSGGQASGSGGQASGSGGQAGGSGALAPCLDQPTAIPVPPNGALPCELIPPGLKL